MRRLLLIVLLVLPSCVTTADWQKLQKDNEELAARFEHNQKEGWTKAEREAFRKRLELNAKDIQDVKPTDLQQIGTILAYLVGAFFFGEKAPMLASMIMGKLKGRPPAK